MKKLLIELTEGLHEGGLREAPNKKVTHMEITRKMDMMVCIMHPLQIVIGTLASLHEVMVEVEVPMVPLVIMDTTLVPQW